MGYAFDEKTQCPTKHVVTIKKGEVVRYVESRVEALVNVYPIGCHAWLLRAEPETDHEIPENAATIQRNDNRRHVNGHYT